VRIPTAHGRAAQLQQAEIRGRRGGARDPSGYDVHMKTVSKLAFALCACASMTMKAQDAVDAPERWSFAAFGTGSLVHSDEDQADFGHTQLMSRGAGYSDPWALNVDTRLGGQVTVNATSSLSAVVQVVAEHRYDDSFRPHVEWANLRYDIGPDLSVRAGRTALPIFLFTESRRVGFALPWVRTPLEVYELVPVTSNDGVDVTWRRRIGEGTNTMQVALGQSASRFIQDGATREVTTRDQFVIADTYELGNLSLRANYGQARVTMDVYRPLFEGFRQFAFLGGDAIADRYELEGRLGRYMGVSVSYQPGTGFVIGELGRLETHAVLGNRTGGYLSAGRRFGNVTPYVTWGAVRLTTPSSDPGLPVPPALTASPLPLLNAALNVALNASPRQSTATVGVRWDVARNTALKLQFDRMDLGANSSGTLTYLQPGFVPGGVVHLVSASVDFVL